MTRIRSTDDSRVQDRRGQGGGGFGFPGLGGGGGGGRLPIPGGRLGGGGLIGLLVVAAIIFLPRLLGGGDGTSLLAPESQQAGGGSADACQTEAEQILCGAFNDAQAYWETAYPQAFSGAPYTPTELVFFSGGVDTGCGPASSQTGPFYCPADGFVYIDLEFLDQLQEQFGAPGDLATQYIVAHEVGHHVQNLTGQNAAVQQAGGETQRLMGIALELQADCYAGTWVHDADRRRNEQGEELIDQGEVSEALVAAASVGDDRIQEQTQGRVNPDSFTHGSAEQREGWFRRGYQSGDPLQCDTFAEI
jgi:predicted metalloprotease